MGRQIVKPRLVVRGELIEETFEILLDATVFPRCQNSVEQSQSARHAPGQNVEGLESARVRRDDRLHLGRVGETGKLHDQLACLVFWQRPQFVDVEEFIERGLVGERLLKERGAGPDDNQAIVR